MVNCNYHRFFSILSMPALVVQWIEQRTPNALIEVRFPARAQIKISWINPGDFNFCPGIERERGRGNGSFPVAEVLKPLGFKKFCIHKIL